MTRGHKVLAAACALAALCALACAGSASALVGPLQPRGDKVFFGVSDTGDPAEFGEFSEAADKHPAVIESFRNWGSDFPDSIRRWQTARARPMIHITTADNNDGHEILTPRAIAQGGGDDYLVRLNKLFAEKEMRAYLRPLGEPNRCLNVYAAYDCAGAARDAAHKPRWYKLAFRRIYVDRPRRRQGEGDQQAPRRSRAAAAERRRSAACRRRRWRSSGARCPPARRPCPRTAPATSTPARAGSTGSGTDFYASYPEWRSLTGLYNRYPDKPFALTEWGVEAGDDPDFVAQASSPGWKPTRAARCSSTTRTSAPPATTGSRTTRPASGSSATACTRRPFPAYAPGAPHLPPPPPGGVGAPRP